MHLKVLGSSSSGNAYHLQFTKNKKKYNILVECGFDYNELLSKFFEFNLKIEDLDFCLITHGHTDHAASMKKLNSLKIPIYSGKKTFEYNQCEYNNDNLLYSYKNKKINDDIYIIPFDVEHDIEDSFGYILQVFDEKVLFINDCKRIKNNEKFNNILYNISFDYIFIECNYIDRMLHAIYQKAKEDLDYIKLKMFDRLLNSHMSLNSCRKTIKNLETFFCKGIFLMHSSKDLSNPFEFKEKIENVCDCNVYICKKNGGII